jgi:hypothetical protein
MVFFRCLIIHREEDLKNNRKKMSQPAIIEVKRPNEVTPLAEVKRPQAGLEKTRVLKKNQPSGCFWFFSGVFVFFFCFFLFLFFLVFFIFLLYICPEERVFRVFSVSRILLGATRL